jgi:hypothetical protein
LGSALGQVQPIVAKTSPAIGVGEKHNFFQSGHGCVLFHKEAVIVAQPTAYKGKSGFKYHQL